jgi:hypothetical protein
MRFVEGFYPDGRMGPTLYLGARTAKVQMCIYDKSLEMLQKLALEMPPTVRYEVRVRGAMNPSYRDAWDPSALFWHYASPDVLTAPSGVPSWSGHHEGFTLPKKPTLLASERASRVAANSHDLQVLGELAAEIPNGVDVVTRMAERRIRRVAASVEHKLARRQSAG